MGGSLYILLQNCLVLLWCYQCLGGTRADHGKISSFSKTVLRTISRFGTHGVIHKKVLVAITLNKWYMMWNADLINHIQINQGVFIGLLPRST